MSALCDTFEQTIADAVQASICETFTTMIGQDITLTRQGPLQLSLEDAAARFNQPQAPDGQMTVVVGLSGDLQGSVSVCMHHEAAFEWTKQLIDHETDQIDQTVVDALGELGNMVVGGAKGRIQDCQLRLGLPSVLLTGRNHLAFPTQYSPMELQFEFGDWCVDVFIALVKSTS
ncbi:MAG: chemotaxis protein CheX [Planctomycetota bacterium]